MTFGLFPLIVFLFIAFPIAEIALLITVGEKIGVLATLAIVIGTAILGTTLLQTQGYGVLARVNQAMREGNMPVEPVMEGMFLFIAGAFLLTPGLITDTIGFVLLVPPLRLAIARFFLSRMLKGGIVSWQVHSSKERDGNRPGGYDPFDGQSSGRIDPGDNVIEGEYERVDEEPVDRDSKG